MQKNTQLYLLLFSLYWAQGLPVGFMTHALPVILRAQGVSLAHIGGFGLLMPWAIKVLWAPFVDQVGHKKLGHYRSWILPTQLFTVVILVVLSFLPIHALNEPIYLLSFFITLFVMNTVGATQDIATDGLAVSYLKGEQQHWGNMFQVVGSRLGFIVGGGAILWALDWLNWQSTFLILATLVLLNTLPILFYTESTKTKSPYVGTKSKVNLTVIKTFLFQIKDYLDYFVHSPMMLRWLFVLIVLKISDGLSGPIIKPLLVDLGLSLSQIGVYITMLGAAAALCGAGLASLILNKISRAKALMLFSVLKVVSLAGFTWLALLHDQGLQVSPWSIYVVNALEDLFAAMLLVVILTLVMQYSRKDYAGTDFTFQVSLMATINGALYTVSGIFGDLFGYSVYLLLISLIAILALFPIILWGKLSRKES